MNSMLERNRIRFIGILTAVLVFLVLARTPLDSDLWWHLRAGEVTLQSGRPMLVDSLSYTRLGVGWINHSWLAEVVMALLFRGAGYLGLSAMVAGVAAVCMALVYRQMQEPPVWRAFVIILAVLVSAPVWSVRPQIFSLLCLVLLNEILRHYQRRGDDRLLLWLIPLFVIWSNLHGGYPLGLILMGCVIGGSALDAWLGREGGLRWSQIWKLVGCGVACFALVAINPNGVNMWRIPFQTVGVNALQQAIPEWASPDFHDLTQQPFLWMLAALIGAMGLAGRAVKGSDLAKVVVFAAMALVARRNYGPFALLAAPVLAESGWAVLERMGEKLGVNQGSKTRPPNLRIQKPVNLAITGILLLVTLGKLVWVSYPAVVEDVLKTSNPVAGVAWLKANRPAGELLNEYSWGGYLTWALPEYPVFVDGRTDLFGDDIIGQWMQVMNAGSGYARVLDDWKVHLVLADPGEPVVNALRQAGWKAVYQDAVCIILEKK